MKALAAGLFLAALLAPADADASHFRYGHMTWKRIAPGSRTVDFTITGAWRSGAVDPHYVNFGDGSANYLYATNIATGTDAAGLPYQVVRYTGRHTYSHNGPFTVSFGSCCRISTLVNARDQSFRVESVVDLRDASNLGSPVSSIPVLLQLPRGGLRTFVLPIADPDGRAYSCRLSTNAEAGWGASQQPNAGGKALSVTSGCMLQWDTTYATLNGKYAAQVMIESNDVPSTDATRVALDFIIEVTNPSGAPTCSGSSGTQTALVGVPFAATFTGTDPNGGYLKNGHLGLPPGATLGPAPGTSAPVPFNSTFSWTPTAADAGTTHAVLVTYTDPTNLQSYCSFSVQVENKQLAVEAAVSGSDRKEIDAYAAATQTVTYPIVVTNRGAGDATDSYTLTVSGGLPGWLASLDRTSFTLAPGASTTAILTVTAPPNLPEALPVGMTIIARSLTNSAINDTATVTTYTNPPPPVTGANTSVLFTSGAGATVSSRITATTISARVRNQLDGSYAAGPGRGFVTFYVAGLAVGTDGDADGDGVYSVQWVPGFSWNNIGQQPLTAIYSGIDLPAGQVDLLPSQMQATITIGQPVDTDGDGLSDEYEQTIGSNPNAADTDGDGLSDGAESRGGTDPTSADTDGDTLTDSAELVRGTDPVNADTDGDGFTDGQEVAAGSDPRNPQSAPAAPPSLTIASPAPNSALAPSSPASNATSAMLGISGNAGTTATITIREGTTTLATFGTTGAWTWSGYLALGAHTLTITASNGAGSSSATVTVYVHPNAPAITSPSNGLVTTNTSVSFSGTGLAGAAVTAFDGGTALGTFLVGSNGTFAGTLTLAFGQHSLTFVQTFAGLSSPAGTPVSVEVRCPPPVLEGVPSDLSLEATSPAGASASFGAPTAASCDGSAIVVQCSGASGATFAKGATTITCTATDHYGQADSASFTITVSDTTPPALSIPADLRLEALDASGAPAFFDVTATDAASVNVSLACSHSTGSLFALGRTTVSCTATDDAGLTTTGSFDVLVEDTTPPAFHGASIPLDQVLEATGADGAFAAFTFPIATDLVDGLVAVSCSHASGTFALGTTLVSCEAWDAAGNRAAPATFTITVLDRTAPALTVPADLVLEATGADGAIATYAAIATDLVDGAPSVSCVPASGSVFALDEATIVTCTALDFSGNSTSASFTVTVLDRTAPVITGAESNLVAEATGADGAQVSWPAPAASDIVDGALAVACAPASGSTFALGATTVTCTSTDAHGNASSTSFQVTVQDTTAPALTIPADLTVTATSARGNVISYVTSAQDLVDGAVSPVCTPASGSLFAPGATLVTCTATDAAGNASTKSFTVRVQFEATNCLQPFKAEGTNTFKFGSTIACKIRLTGASAGIADGSFRLFVAKWSNDAAGEPIDALSTSAATEGNLFRYDATAGQYIFNLNTKPLSAGTWVLLIDLGDGVLRQQVFALK